MQLSSCGKKANEVVVELEHYGMPFDRTDDGKIYQRPFGGHMSNFAKSLCAAHAQRLTVQVTPCCMRCISAMLKQIPSFSLSGWRFDLIRDEEGHVLGVTAMEMETGQIVIFHARATIFATGGAGRIYYSSTNAFINTGDGLGMAARAGIPLKIWSFGSSIQPVWLVLAS